jgi:hypothetical protein
MATAPVDAELERMFRVADQSCSAHANLSQRLDRRALALELTTLLASIWLIAVAFVTPPANAVLTPFDWNPQIWTGCLGVGVFFLTLLQTFVGWKTKAEAHRRSCSLHAEIKSDAGQALKARPVTKARFDTIAAKYNLVGQLAVPIPEREFLKQKKRHRTKVAISKELDKNPHSSIIALRIRLWWRDNVRFLRP